MKQQEPAQAQTPSIDGLLSKAAKLQAQLHTLALAALEDPAKLDIRMRVKEELDCIPTQIGALRKREVLDHLAAMQKEAARLTVEVAAAQAALDAHTAEYAELENERRKTPGPARSEVTARMHVKTKGADNAALVGVLMQKQARLDGLYATATRSYGVFLDGSDRQLLHRDGLHPSLSYAGAATEQAWEQAASRIGLAAEQDARRTLCENGSAMARMRL